MATAIITIAIIEHAVVVVAALHRFVKHAHAIVV